MKAKQLDLIPVRPTAPSRHVSLRVFCDQHGILTYRTEGMNREDEPWIAVLPTSEDRGKSIGQIMAERCRWYDECGMAATGAGKLSVVRKLCELNGIESP